MKAYARQYGWDLITAANITEKFWFFVAHGHERILQARLPQGFL
ncbi:hypothetical protein [Eubacterium sp.]